MITRRSFLAALCALPFVGKFIPKPLELTSENYRLALREQAKAMAFEWDKRAYDLFAAPTLAEVNDAYAERYGAVDSFYHPRYLDDVQRLRARIEGTTL